MKGEIQLSKRRILLSISLVMLVIAAVFVAVALQNPQLGTAIRVGSLTFGAEAWRVCYAVYLLVTAGLFGASFAVK